MIAKFTSLLNAALGKDVVGSVLKDGAQLFFVRIAGLALSFLSSVVLARILGVSEFGTYALAMVILTVISIPVQLGLPALVARETPRLKEAQNWGQLKALWRWVGFAILFASFVIVGLVLVWMIWLAPGLLPELRTTLLFGLPLIPIMAFIAVIGAAIRGLQRTALGQLAEELLRPLFLITALGCLVAFSNLSAPMAIGVHSFVALLAMIMGFVLLQKIKPCTLSIVKATNGNARVWVRSVVPLSLISSIYLLNQSTDILMIGFLLETFEVGLYRVALAGLALGLFALRLMDILMGPQFARLLEKQEMAQLSHLAGISAAISFALTIPIVIVFWIFGSALISLIFGPDFAPSYYPLAILLSAQTAAALIGPNGVVLIMARHEKAALLAMVLATLVNTALNAFLIPKFGITGAAVATGIAVLVRSGFLWFVAYRKLGIDTSVLSILRGA